MLESGREEGFTIIELLVVIALISILAAIASLSVSKFRANAILKACESDAKSVEIAARSYQAVNGDPAPAQPAADGTFPADPNKRLVPKYILNWPISASYRIFWDGASDAYGENSTPPPARTC